MQRIRKGDQVIITTGKDKGKVGEVSKVLVDKVVVEGLNLVKKHIKGNQMTGESGGIQNKEMPIHISNVAIYNSETKKADKVGFKMSDDGQKVRFFKSNGNLV